MSFKSIKARFWQLLVPVSSFLLWIGGTFQEFLMMRIARLTFQPRPDDIFIVTYPKSGTTLMQMILYQLKTDGRMDFPHINTVCPWIELEFARHNERFLESIESPRCFKTHLLYHRFPAASCKFIYLLRDVRDVVVSAYHHDRLLLGIDQSLEDFTDKFLRSGWLGVPSWFEHLESWWPHRHDPNVLFLSYEDMIADLEGTIRKVAHFCGIAFREEDMPRVLERCSFEFMKQHDEKFDFRFQRALPGNQRFIRQGKPGSGRELAPRHQEMFSQKLAAAARKLGCERGEPYRELITGD